MALIKEVNPDTDIWKEYPSLKLIREFRELKEKEGEERSSNIIKAIFLIWDEKGKLRNSGIEEDQLIRDVSESLLDDGDFDWEAYEDFKNFFLTVNLSKSEAMLLKQENEILSLDKLLATWKWTQKDAEKRAKIVKERKILFEEYIEVRERVKQESEVDLPLEGGYRKSLIERLGTDE